MTKSFLDKSFWCAIRLLTWSAEYFDLINNSKNNTVNHKNAYLFKDTILDIFNLDCKRFNTGVTYLR